MRERERHGFEEVSWRSPRGHHVHEYRVGRRGIVLEHCLVKLPASTDPCTSPAVAAIGERLLFRVDHMATELTELIRSTEAFYRAGGMVPAEDLRASVLDNLVLILSRFAGRP